MNVNARCSFPASEASPARARAWIDARLGADADGLSVTRALTSELVADAIRRHPTRIDVHLERDDRLVRVEVGDCASGLLDLTDDGVERDIRRNLVDALATRWGAGADHDRTAAWFEVATEDRRWEMVA
jgi:hypothetical protein